jgi:CHAD domain-containing protein
VDLLADDPTDAELHGVRIGAKRCRYAAEACAPSLGKQTRRLARATKALQEVLGELSDAVAAERWLREWAERTGSRSGAFAAGELAMLERAAADRARSRWPKAWKRVTAVTTLDGWLAPGWRSTKCEARGR